VEDKWQQRDSRSNVSGRKGGEKLFLEEKNRMPSTKAVLTKAKTKKERASRTTREIEQVPRGSGQRGKRSLRPPKTRRIGFPTEMGKKKNKHLDSRKEYYFNLYLGAWEIKG